MRCVAASRKAMSTLSYQTKLACGPPEGEGAEGEGAVGEGAAGEVAAGKP